MARPIFMGIENEFQVMRNRNLVKFHRIFRKALANYHRPIFKKTNTAIRTRIGSAIYNDEEVAEACTPPVRLCRGFATQLTDLLYLSRKELLEFVAGTGKQYSMIGYSTHYNITRVVDSNWNRIMREIGVPISLLTLSPTSQRNLLEPKGFPERIQLRADFLLDEDQTKAFLNFYAGAMLFYFSGARGYTSDHKSPFQMIDPLCLQSGGNNAEKGRYTKVDIETSDRRKRTIYAQDYLEAYYYFLKKAIASLATPEEMKNLEAFISGDKQLEADRVKAALAKACLKYRRDSFLGTHPLVVIPPEMFTQERPIPTLLAKGMGRFANDTTHYDAEPEKKRKDCEGCVQGRVTKLEWYESSVGSNDIVRSTGDFEKIEEILTGCTTEDEINRRIGLIRIVSKHSGDFRFVPEFRGLNHQFRTELQRCGAATTRGYTREGRRLIEAYTRCDSFNPPKELFGVTNMDARLKAAGSRVMNYDPAQDSSYDLGDLTAEFPTLRTRARKEKAREMLERFPELRQAIKELD